MMPCCRTAVSCCILRPFAVIADGLLMTRLFPLRPGGLVASVLCLVVTLCLDVHTAREQNKAAQATRRPNILLAIADDWSWPHAGAYGDPTVKTPVFDRIAREGALFTHAFAAAPSCTPSRAALLTGRYPHQLEEGGVLHGFLPDKFPVYTDLLERAGYYVGYTRKGWGPGRFEPGGRPRNPAGVQFGDFDAFLRGRPAGQPFVFWFGSQDPHRPYEEGSGAASGIDLASIRVPTFLPDTPEVRGDLADYFFEVQRFDREVGQILERLRTLGELDNTLVVITADNGMPFPRAKANVYDSGARLPFAMRWPGRVRPGLVADAFINLSDLAPTFLEAAGLTPPESMSARSILGLAAGGSEQGRDRVFVERERHAHVRAGNLSYPVRAVRTDEWLYIRNFRPDRWPAGDPEMVFSVGPYGDIDGGVSKTLLLERRNDPAIARFFALATAIRPAEELYDLKTDPDQLTNVAADPGRSGAKANLRRMLDEWMRTTGDPRATVDDDRWDRYPYYGQPGTAPAR
ncbi:MAG: heparan N-sulfatase [Acidobacteria bacterium]|nr:MAG: heparan N-sulfatase [Acidobacteriota bacterium]